MVKLKNLGEILTAEEIRAILGESFSNKNDDIDFESFLRVSQWKMVFPGISFFSILWILKFWCVSLLVDQLDPLMEMT